MDKSLKETIVKWNRARERFMGCTQSAVLKKELREAERELRILAKRLEREDEASVGAEAQIRTDSSDGVACSETRWIDCLKMMPEKIMAYERVQGVVPTEYATQEVYVMDEAKTLVSTDYRLITINGDVWKSRRRWRWWMPKSMLRKVPTGEMKN